MVFFQVVFSSHFFFIDFLFHSVCFISQKRFADDVILRCFGTRLVNHLLRALDFKDEGQLAAAASAPFRRALDDVLEKITSDEQFTLACLASRRGGLGPKNPTLTHGPAFLVACFTYAASADSLSAAFSEGSSEGFWDELSSAWHLLRSAFNLPVNCF